MDEAFLDEADEFVYNSEQKYRLLEIYELDNPSIALDAFDNDKALVGGYSSDKSNEILHLQFDVLDNKSSDNQIQEKKGIAHPSC